MNIPGFLKQESAFIRSSLKIQNANWIYSLSMKIILGCFFISIALIIWRRPMLPPMIPLWYSKAWGGDRLASAYWIFLLPVMSLVWHGLDIILSIYVTREHYIFTQVLFLSSLFVALFSMIAVANIVFLIT